MKKIIVFTMLLITATTTFSQQTNPFSPTLTKQGYLQKSRHQKVAAWSLLLGGITSGIIGTVIASKEVLKIVIIPIPGIVPPDEKKLNGGAALMVAGGAALLGSIPLFIASSKNKMRAASLSLKNETMQQLYKNSFTYKPVPSLSLTIHL